MNEGDFVRIEFIGRIKESGEIIDLTDEELAKKKGIYNPNVRYGPIPIIVGAKFLLPGLEEAVMQMKVGEKRKVEIPSEKAFGPRKAELVRSFPLAEFTSRNIKPVPGLVVSVSGIRGKVVSVTGGRVKVDFNHPLAGKDLEYEIEIKEKIEDEKEKIKAILMYFTGMKEEEFEIEKEGKDLKVKILPKITIPVETKSLISATIKKWVEGIEKIIFIEEF